MKTDLKIEKLFNEIEGQLELSRKIFLRNFLDEDQDGLRSLEEAKLILKSLQEVAEISSSIFENFPSLKSTFTKEFGEFERFISRDNLLNVCFVEEYLFPEVEEFPLVYGSVVETELINNYVLSFKDWIHKKVENHKQTQELILENFTLSIKQGDLECQCTKCTADFRAKLRDFVYSENTEMIDEAVEMLDELMVDKSIAYLSDYVSKLRKRIEKNLSQVRYRLKRGSLNKLDSDIKSHLKRKIGYSSELGRVYKERLLTYLKGILNEDDLNQDLVSDAEYERFFTQLNVGIWKSPIVLKRDFQKLVRSVQAFKRKDISATILREYLGQFWIHAAARSKKRRIIYHMGPTNSGKTYNAIEALSKAKNGCYLAPLRLLASELFDTLNNKGAKTSLLTGEEVIETTGATHFSSTIEMAKLQDEFECVVIDEIQMITDTQRGWAWTRALVNMNADEIHLCGDHSVLELVKKILDLTGDTLEVNEYERKTTLTVLEEPIKLVDLQKNDALIVFSRRNALKYKRDLENLGFKVSIVYGRLSPEVRREQARKFDEGETDIMVSTDAIAMGMNLPVKRIVFSATSKFFDSKEFPLTSSELKQIAGRAGRFQRFPEGFVTTLKKVEDGVDIVRAALEDNLDQKELAMVGPDLEIFRSVNQALEENSLKLLSLSEFLQLFNAMTFEKPFYCVDLKEMIEVTEMIEGADQTNVLTDSEIFGFACAPVNLGLTSHVQYYMWILNHYVGKNDIVNEKVDCHSDDIDYLETAIKCVELYQWLARHFDNNNFTFNLEDLLENKSLAVEKLNHLLSEKVSQKCSSCGVKLDDDHKFNICETCFGERRGRRPGNRSRSSSYRDKDKKSKSSGPGEKKEGRGSRRAPAKGGKKKSKKNKAAAFKRG